MSRLVVTLVSAFAIVATVCAVAALRFLAPVPCPPAARPPAAVAIVVEGEWLWMGNDEYADDDRVAGHYRSVVDGIDRGLRSLPPDTEVAFVDYASPVRVIVPLTPAHRVSGSMLGEQRHFHGTRDLVDGIDVALDELARSSAERRVLLVIGDGSHVDHERALTQLPALRLRAAAEGVETVALVVYDTTTPRASVERSIAAFTDAVTESDFHVVESIARELRAIGRGIARGPSRASL